MARQWINSSEGWSDVESVMHIPSRFTARGIDPPAIRKLRWEGVWTTKDVIQRMKVAKGGRSDYYWVLEWISIVAGEWNIK